MPRIFAAEIPLLMNLNGKFPLTPTPLPEERGTSRGQGCIVFMGAMREKTLRWIHPSPLPKGEGDLAAGLANSSSDLRSPIYEVRQIQSSRSSSFSN
jgi:hypothetical protein